MTPENFTFWLNGFFELTPPGPLTAEQAQVIKNHLQLVFNKVTPTTPINPNPYYDPSKVYCYGGGINFDDRAGESEVYGFKGTYSDRSNVYNNPPDLSTMKPTLIDGNFAVVENNSLKVKNMLDKNGNPPASC